VTPRVVVLRVSMIDAIAIDLVKCWLYVLVLVSNVPESAPAMIHSVN
jgi:hypothetical protein